MEALEATYSFFETNINGDTGSGGLKNATGNQYVREVLWGAITREQGTYNIPALVIDIVPAEMGHEAYGRSFQALARIRIVTDRDKGIAEEGAILDRLVNLFHGATTLESPVATGWSFSYVTYLRAVQIQDGKYLRPVAEFQVIATK